MSVAEPSPHPRAVEARVRKATAYNRQARALAPGVQEALRHLSLVNHGLVLQGALFVSPIARPPVRIDVARKMHRAGLVRFESTMEGHRLHLTDFGRRLAMVLGAK